MPKIYSCIISNTQEKVKTNTPNEKVSNKFNVYPDNTTYMVNHIIGVVDGLESKVQSWTERLAETKADRDAQEKMIAEPFAKQAELEAKTARYNEVMAILNPKEEQVIGEDDGETQYQAREQKDIRDDIYYPKNGRDASAFLRSYADKTSGLKNGTKKNMVVFTEDDAYFVTATGYLRGDIVKVLPVLGNEDVVRSTIKEFLHGTDEVTKAVNQFLEILQGRAGRSDWNNVGVANGKTASGAYELDAEQSESDSVGYSWENYGYDSIDELYEAIQNGAMVMDDDGNLIQNQPRTSPMTDREVLSVAASDGERGRSDRRRKGCAAHLPEQAGCPA